MLTIGLLRQELWTGVGFATLKAENWVSPTQ